ncbi:MAG TPA: thioredoxin family protein [Plasticicumulans sp.]|uniref:thioredoxin family protein n=1 Tax=Plasticicumulans sp. TaxID=2307179 RepID=UPI002C76F0CD|nr:thioredoxin family protein [Plasticicumulans sp.]MBS0601125.1 TM0996/MTH895 family glutaredoxin-like protein [Pseudomonadota bacterium]HMV38727.1 thioredoxin family protein [Plasticicumulans sp.]HMW27929.1 thioredoxin family protein [Plasticicumulans sp.]HMW28003.1 thioredoxin family protein [Plasticicumulans sp.]HMW42485.1 thioredoxin family protein [Plasticicumulans sp.]
MNRRKIQILGSGCQKCRKLAEYATQAADELGLDWELEKITDPARIAGFGVMQTPALAVDGVVKLAGHLAGVAELKRLLG